MAAAAVPARPAPPRPADVSTADVSPLTQGLRAAAADRRAALNHSSPSHTPFHLSSGLWVPPALSRRWPCLQSTIECAQAGQAVAIAAPVDRVVSGRASRWESAVRTVEVPG